MDKLVEVLANKMGYTLIGIIGFLMPGFLFVFIWNRELFLELDIIKTVLLSLFIPLSLFVATCIAWHSIFDAGDEKSKQLLYVTMMIIHTNIEMVIAMLYKLYHPDFSILYFIDIIIKVLGVIFLFNLFLEGIKKLTKKEN